MRIFLAGATGVIGIRLMPLLLESGHEVVGLTRTDAKAGSIRELGADPLVGDVFDREWLKAAVAGARVELIMHQLTDLPDQVGEIPMFRERNDRIRTEGTHNLLEAARGAGISRFVAQSIAWEPPGGAEAVQQHERMVLDFGGVVLRYGQLYGPGTFYEGEPPDPPRIHVDAAAQRTAELLEAPSGAVVVTDVEAA